MLGFQGKKDHSNYIPYLKKLLGIPFKFQALTTVSVSSGYGAPARYIQNANLLHDDNRSNTKLEFPCHPLAR